MDYSVGVLKTILLVDDDPNILIAWKRVLQLAGYCVETAGDGVTGMAVAKQIQPDLIITDRSMPGMSGIDLCRRLRREPMLAKTPLILATADYEFTFGAPIWDDLWQKPVSLKTMRDSIQRLLP
jgi:CheY-like chemotaxis protein